MDLYEHQGKDLFARARHPRRRRGIVAATPRRRRPTPPRELGGRSVVKVQVQVGGRGKGGGVELVDSPERAAERGRADARAMGSRDTRSRASWSRSCCRSRGVLHVDPARPLHRQLPRDDDGRGRDGHRGARPQRPEAHPPRAHRPAARASDLPPARADGRAAARGPRGRGRRPREAVRVPRARPTRPSSRSTRSCCSRTGACRARREGHDRRQRAVPPRRTSRPCGQHSRSTRSRRARRRPDCST